PIVNGLVPVSTRLGSRVGEERHHGSGGGLEDVDVAGDVRLRPADDDRQRPRGLMIGFVPAHVLGQMLAPVRTSQVRNRTPNLITSPPKSYSMPAGESTAAASAMRRSIQQPSRASDLWVPESILAS